MARKRNPYVNRLTLEEIAHAEANHYYIQVGEETAEYQGRQTFSKQKAEYLFWELMASMRHMTEHGSQAEKNIARIGLTNFRIHSLRIH